MAGIINKQPPIAKNVTLYVNGDGHSKGRRLVIQRNVNNMEHFFKLATECIKPNFGAVRNLYTPNGGTRITNYEEIETGHSYVAGGSENFRFLSRGAKYEEIGTRKPRPIKKTYSHIKPVSHNYRLNLTSGRYKEAVRVINQPVQLWLHVNADNQSDPIRLLLPSRILKLKWDMILEYITDRVGIRLGHAVRKLYSTDGDVVSSVKTLITGRTYVACGSERFRKLNYKLGSNSNVSHLHILKRKPLPPIGIKPQFQASVWNNTENNERGEHHENQYSNKYHNHNKHSKNNPNKEEYESMLEKMQKHKK